MMYYTFFCTITLLTICIFSLFQERRQRIQRRLSFFLDADLTEASEAIENKQHYGSLYQRIFYPFLNEIKRIFRKKISGEKEAKIEIKLLQAGSPWGMTAVDFRIFQLALILALPTLCTILLILLKVRFSLIFLFLILSFVAAVLFPNYLLIQKTKRRSYQALRELPDVVDLLTVSLEAGLGFDSALSKLISKKTGILADEFHRCLEEIRLGRTRREALKGVKERILVEELGTLINSILQAEKMGISMVHILRIQSQEIRQQRKQRAEEEAMKAPIKMLFPLVLFIFPSLFIVLLGPALIQFLTTFGK